MVEYINRIVICFVFTILILSSAAQAGTQEELKKQYNDKIRELNEILSRYLHQLGIETNKLQQEELKKQYDSRLRDYFNNFGKDQYYKNWVSIGDIEIAKGRLYDSDISIDIDPKFLKERKAVAMYVVWNPFYNPFKRNTLVLADIPNNVDPASLWHELTHAILTKNEKNEKFLAYDKDQETYTWYAEQTTVTTHISLNTLERQLKKCVKSSEFLENYNIAIAKGWKSYEDTMKKFRADEHMDDSRIDQLKRWTGFDIDLNKIKEKYESGEATNGIPVNLATGECGTQNKKNNQDNEAQRKGNNTNVICKDYGYHWGRGGLLGFCIDSRGAITNGEFCFDPCLQPENMMIDCVCKNPGFHHP